MDRGDKEFLQRFDGLRERRHSEFPLLTTTGSRVAAPGSAASRLSSMTPMTPFMLTPSFRGFKPASAATPNATPLTTVSGGLPGSVGFDSAGLKKRRPFDDTVLNINDSLIRKRRKSNDVTGSSDGDSLNTTLGTPWETKHLRSELTQARAEIKTLESKNALIAGQLRETVLLLEHEKTTSQSSAERDRNTICELERRIRTLKRKEEKLREELMAAVEGVDSDRQDFEAKALEVHAENIKFREQVNELESENRNLELKLKTIQASADKFESELKVTGEQLTAVVEQVESMRKTIREGETTKATLTNAQHRIKELESEMTSWNETASLLKTQQAKLAKYGELERQLSYLTKQNARLKENTTNTLLLETVVEELKERLSSSEATERDLVKTRVELGVVEGKLDEFRTTIESILGPSGQTSVTPSKLIDYVKKLHAESLNRANSQAQLQNRVDSLEATGQKLTSTNGQLVEEIAQLKRDLEASSNNIRRLKKQNALVTWERNDLRSLVDSCQREVTIVGNQDPRIDTLERLVANYRAKLQEIESDPAISVTSETVSKGPDPKILEDLQRENEELKKEKGKLEFELEHRALKGDFNTMETKVIHFKMNPADEALEKRSDEVGRLRTEVAMLKQRLKLVMEGESSDLTQNVANIVNEDTIKELNDLREKVKNQDMANQRLTEVFKSSSREFREAIYLMFGYKVDGLKNKTYRLSSIYSESPNQHLLFKVNNAGGIELLETEFSSTLTELVELVLVRHNSIPLFLASLTVDLFNKTTHTILDATWPSTPLTSKKM